ENGGFHVLQMPGLLPRQKDVFEIGVNRRVVVDDQDSSVFTHDSGAGGIAGSNSPAVRVDWAKFRLSFAGRQPGLWTKPFIFKNKGATSIAGKAAGSWWLFAGARSSCPAIGQAERPFRARLQRTSEVIGRSGVAV